MRVYSWAAVLAAATVFAVEPERVEGGWIASWDFNDGDLVVDAGAGMLTTNFPPADLRFSTGSARNALEGVVAGQSLLVENQVHNGIGRLDFQLDTRGQSGLTMSLATQRSGTGFNANQLSISSDGGSNFTNVGAVYTPSATSFELLTFDLSGYASLNNNPDAWVRITFGGATSGTGNNRLDNVLFTASASAIPEPPAWMIAAAVVMMAGVGLVTLRFGGARMTVAARSAKSW